MTRSAARAVEKELDRRESEGAEVQGRASEPARLLRRPNECQGSSQNLPERAL